MERGTTLELMRLLHGELPADAARALERRLAAEPALAARYRELRERWEGLALPEVPALPPGFTGRVMAHVRSEARGEGKTLSWSVMPFWVRAAAAAALLIGLGLGAGLGLLPARKSSPATPNVEAFAWSRESPLGDVDWLGIEEEGHP